MIQIERAYLKSLAMTMDPIFPDWKGISCRSNRGNP